MQNSSDIKKPIFWFDMDGVLAKYDYDIYAPADGSTPHYMVRQKHMYRNMEPNPAAMALFNHMYRKSKQHKEYYVRTLTGIPVGLLQAEHTIDKYFWIAGRVKNFDQDDFFCTSVEKHSAVASDLWKLTEHDILIDDYNPNLENWKKSGGTPIKYVNGINSPRNDMPNIIYDMQPKDMAACLEAIAYKITDRHGKCP